MGGYNSTQVDKLVEEAAAFAVVWAAAGGTPGRRML